MCFVLLLLRTYMYTSYRSVYLCRFTCLLVSLTHLVSGFAGLYDYGPMGCAMKTNLINIWRQHFVIQDNLLEIDTPTLAPAVVLK